MVQIRKAIVLAGGLGTRLRPLTNKIPKPLIPLGDGRTLTEHVFDILKRAGVNDIILSLCYKAEEIQRYFSDGSKHDVKINYAIEKEPMGTAGPLILTPRIEEPFIIVNGDNLFDIDLKKMHKFHKENNAIVTIALTRVDDPSNSGVVRLDGNKIVEFVEKPKKGEEPSNLISSGYYIVEPEIFDHIPKEDFVMLEKHVFPKLAEEGKLFGYFHDGKWFDTGTHESYERVKKEW